jgi:hypothetical protein
MKVQPRLARGCLALLCSVALLYFAVGGTFTHQHASNSACHTCQALHMPALAASPLGLVAESLFVVSYVSQLVNVAPVDSFSLHRASRAPPCA